MANIVPSQHRPAPITRRFGEWDPFELMRDLLTFDPARDMARRWFGEDPSSFAPRFDVREQNDCYMIQADMPGIKESNVDISVTGNRLVISGQRAEEKTEDSKSYFTRERSFGSFSRAFSLPETIDSEHIRASMEDGVLEIAIPKRAESQPRKIALQTKDGGSQSSEQPPSKPAPREEGM